MRLCQNHEAESFRFAAYGSYVNTYAPAGLRVSGSFISSGSTKMSQERWFQKFLGFHLKLRKITYFMSNLAYLSMLKPPKREEPKTSKGPSRTRRESASSTSGPWWWRVSSKLESVKMAICAR